MDPPNGDFRLHLMDDRPPPSLFFLIFHANFYGDKSKGVSVGKRGKPVRGKLHTHFRFQVPESRKGEISVADIEGFHSSLLEKIYEAEGNRCHLSQFNFLVGWVWRKTRPQATDLFFLLDTLPALSDGAFRGVRHT